MICTFITYYTTTTILKVKSSGITMFLCNLLLFPKQSPLFLQTAHEMSCCFHISCQNRQRNPPTSDGPEPGLQLIAQKFLACLISTALRSAGLVSCHSILSCLALSVLVLYLILSCLVLSTICFSQLDLPWHNSAHLGQLILTRLSFISILQNHQPSSFIWSLLFL